MILLGAPEAIVVDSAARGRDTDRLLAELDLQVVPADAHGLTLGRPSVGLFGADHPPVVGCYGWFVGAGPEPEWMHPAQGRAGDVLALLGTGFAQERAGAAFRAAGAGQSPPAATHYDAPAILAGITAAVSAAPATSSLGSELADVPDTVSLLQASFAVIARCCAPTGAIAAVPAPVVPGGPDYRFFWQRDAAAVAFALHGLARWGPDAGVRAGAQGLLDRYLDFLAELGPRLARTGDVAAGRCTLAGQPVAGYGSPQHDGPAASALVVLSVVEDPAVALWLARPFLDHVCGAARAPGGYDLWELMEGRSFHATNLARRALARAAEVARLAGEDAEVYRATAVALGGRLAAFRDPASGCYLRGDGGGAPWFRAISGLDMGSIGSALLGPDDPSGPDLSATLAALTSRYATRWAVNTRWRDSGRLGGGIGRFPEDCNDGTGSTGANPWPVTTLWAAQWHLRFGRRDLGLGYLDFVLAHVDAGAVPEQVDGRTGQARGAGPLGWAHAELVTAVLDRDRRAPSVSPGGRGSAGGGAARGEAAG